MVSFFVRMAWQGAGGHLTFEVKNILETAEEKKRYEGDVARGVDHRTNFVMKKIFKMMMKKTLDNTVL